MGRYRTRLKQKPKTNKMEIVMEFLIGLIGSISFIGIMVILIILIVGNTSSKEYHSTVNLDLKNLPKEYQNKYERIYVVFYKNGKTKLIKIKKEVGV